MIVLSLFDGISAGMLALKRAGIPVTKYYASEIDKHAIAISKFNHPEIIHLGDINDWWDWDIEDPDIILAGSPCQGFSIAGKGLNFDDPRSKLFFTFVDILFNYLPDYFLLENVRMKKEWQQVINNYLNLEPTLINSALVSAQSRPRLYWTNIPYKGLPEDTGTLLKDVVFPDAIFRTDGEEYPIALHNVYGGFGETSNRVFMSKSPTIRTAAGGGHIPSLLLSEKALAYMDRQVADGRTHWDFNHHSDTKNPKSSAVVANFFKGVPYNVLRDGDIIRHFHPVECERLQTMPDLYTQYGDYSEDQTPLIRKVSKTQRYKAIGNSWTVDVITHILKGIDEI